MSQIKYCIIPGCESTNKSSSLFEIPRNNSDLMEKWKKQLPMLNGFSYTSSSLICQDHFRSDEIICQTDQKLLTPGAVPTIFDINQMLTCQNLCRFCMNFLQNTENVWISEQVKNSFQNLMQTEVRKNYSYFKFKKINYNSFNSLMRTISCQKGLAQNVWRKFREQRWSETDFKVSRTD